MDIHNPFGEEVKPAPGNEYQKLAGELSSFVSQVGGPRLNEDALATLIADLFAWLKH